MAALVYNALDVSHGRVIARTPHKLASHATHFGARPEGVGEMRHGSLQDAFQPRLATFDIRGLLDPGETRKGCVGHGMRANVEHATPRGRSELLCSQRTAHRGRRSGATQFLQEMLDQLKAGWHLSPQSHLERLYQLPDFARALEFANKVGAIAEAEGHHPDLYVAWGKCKVEVWTHKVDGLTESDFYLAAKADRAHESMAAPAS